MLARGEDSRPQHAMATVESPEIIAAYTVAYRDFSKRLKGWEEKWSASGHQESANQRYASDVDNYSVTVSSDDKNVYVTFELKPFQGRSSFGGVTRYTVDRKTCEIVEHTVEK
jgi:hypothetical protein